MLFGQYTVAKVSRRRMTSFFLKRDLILFSSSVCIINWGQYRTTIDKKGFQILWALAREESQIRLTLPLLLSRTSEERFFLPGSVLPTFRVFSNALPRFARLALCLSPLAFFGRSLSFHPTYFNPNPFPTNLN